MNGHNKKGSRPNCTPEATASTHRKNDARHSHNYSTHTGVKQAPSRAAQDALILFRLLPKTEKQRYLDRLRGLSARGGAEL